jgi:DNA invertase Pin-like site-specific DNA recombinase
MHHKVNPTHLGRKAIVYLRQSSPGQVRDNVESQHLQYAMVDRARELGWTQIEVIDADLGHSASVGAPRREGFERLVAQVSLGEVGAIFSYEVSRLSRTDKDWCQLFEICPLLDTLVADDQHVYDLNIADDQLILGIKGTISVMELRTIKARLVAGQEEKARRGELVRVLAPGYVKDAIGKMVKDPNQRVQQAMLLVFDRFRATGTIRQTFKWFQDEKVALPVNQFRDGKRELGWQLPTHAFIADVLKNATYAGVYVYGRRSTETVVRDGRPVRRLGAYAARKAEGGFVWPASSSAAPPKQRLMDVPAAAKSEPR